MNVQRKTNPLSLMLSPAAKSDTSNQGNGKVSIQTKEMIKKTNAELKVIDGRLNHLESISENLHIISIVK